jgi:hypothetical protein
MRSDEEFLELGGEPFREEGSSDFGEDGMELDDAMLQGIDLAEMEAMQTQGDDAAFKPPEQTSKSGLGPVSGLHSIRSSLASSSSTAIGTGSMSSTSVREIIVIDDDDDKENLSLETRRVRRRTDRDIISISDSD